MKPEEWQHSVPIRVLGSQLSSITLLLLWRTRRSSASSTFRAVPLLVAFLRRGWCFILSWCAELMERLQKHSGHSWPQNTNVRLSYQHSLQLHDGRFPVFASLVLQEQFSDWWTGSNGRVTIHSTNRRGRLTVQELSSSCKQSQSSQTLVWSKKAFVLLHVDRVCTPVFCRLASRRCFSWFSPSFLLLRLPLCQALRDKIFRSRNTF